MDISMLLAKIVGLYGLVASVSALLNLKRIKYLVDDLLNNEALLYLSALLALALGIVIINIHNVVAYDYRLIITLFGWISFMQGVIFLLVPDLAYAIIRRIINYNAIMLLGVLICLASSFWLLKEGLSINLNTILQQ